MDIKNFHNAVIEVKGIPKTTSLKVAELTGKEHYHILRDIDDLLSKCSVDFKLSNFGELKRKTKTGEYRYFEMTKDGFTMLAMGYTGKDFIEFKEKYIKRFNDMENFITSKLLAKEEFPQLTDNIKLIHEEPKFYHYSNEMDMINRIVTGKSASQIRKENELEKGASIRPYLNEFEIEMIMKLQRADVGMVLSIPNFEDRKYQLKKYFSMLRDNKKQPK